MIEAADEAYDRLLREAGGLDYADLIVLGTRLLREDETVATSVRRRFRFVFVDEFHDLSPDQWTLLRLIAPPVAAPVHPDDQPDEPTAVMVVADPDQAIYGFRDANPARLLADFRRHYRPRRYVLTENYRSTATIVRLAGALRSDRTSGPPLSPVAPDGMPVHCVAATDEWAEAEALVGLVRRAGELRGYAPEDIAVLYRVNRRADLAEAAPVAGRYPDPPGAARPLLRATGLAGVAALPGPRRRDDRPLVRAGPELAAGSGGRVDDDPAPPVRGPAGERWPTWPTRPTGWTRSAR